MSTTIYESKVIDAPLTEVWRTVSGLDFAWLPSVVSCVLEGKADAREVGGVRTVTYKDGTVQKIKLTELSDARTEVSWDLLESAPAANALSTSWTLKLTEVRFPSLQTFLEWTSDFSRDATAAVLADAKFKATENFTGIYNATKARVVGDANKGERLPALKRQLSSKSALLLEAFKKLDKNGDGVLQLDEFTVCVQKLLGVNFPEAIMQVMLMEADLDGSGDIDFEEFCQFLGREASGDAGAAAAAAKK